MSPLGIGLLLIAASVALLGFVALGVSVIAEKGAPLRSGCTITAAGFLIVAGILLAFAVNL